MLLGSDCRERRRGYVSHLRVDLGSHVSLLRCVLYMGGSHLSVGFV